MGQTGSIPVLTTKVMDARLVPSRAVK